MFQQNNLGLLQLLLWRMKNEQQTYAIDMRDQLSKCCKQQDILDIFNISLFEHATDISCMNPAAAFGKDRVSRIHMLIHIIYQVTTDYSINININY